MKRKKKIWRPASILATLLLTACGGDSQVTALLRLDVQDIGFAEPALTRSVNAFIGNDGSASGGGQGDNATGGSGKNLDGVAFEILDLHEIAFGLGTRHQLGTGREVGAHLLFGRGQTKIELPDGVDVFVEPITVTAETRFVEVILDGEQKLPLRGFLSGRVFLAVEAGYRHTRSRVALRSPLIRRDDTGEDNQFFLGAGVSFALGPGRATRVDLGARHVEGALPIARLGIERRF